MLLLLVQGKLTNLTIDEDFAFNVSLRMFTRSIVIQRRVKDHQLGVESYQKKLNLTKPNTYRSDLKRKEAYTAYSNSRGFVYQNKDKQNRLMRIDELHKFSDDTLNDVRTALDDRLKGIRMQYPPQTIWRQKTAKNVQPDRNPKAQNRPFDAACQRANAENVHADRRAKAQSSPFNASCQIGKLILTSMVQLQGHCHTWNSRRALHILHAGDKVTSHPCSEHHTTTKNQIPTRYQLKYSTSNAKISPSTRKGSGDFAVNNILDKPDKPALGQTTSSDEKKGVGREGVRIQLKRVTMSYRFYQDS
uniref:Uncharacterized protein n=1 Tax=Tanacetum cinerariifolium TaxID=118510 RepID=A0A6L2N818_TANCI|nr:hypothetical protein [Tanacetum cinerariifolium]